MDKTKWVLVTGEYGFIGSQMAEPHGSWFLQGIELRYLRE